MAKKVKFPVYFYEGEDKESCGVVIEEFALAIKRSTKRQVYQSIQAEINAQVDAMKKENMDIPKPRNIAELPLKDEYGGTLDIVEVEIDY